MYTVEVILPANPFLGVALFFMGVAIGFRIVRWVLDILP